MSGENCENFGKDEQEPDFNLTVLWVCSSENTDAKKNTAVETPPRTSLVVLIFHRSYSTMKLNVIYLLIMIAIKKQLLSSYNDQAFIISFSILNVAPVFPKGNDKGNTEAPFLSTY